jgi:hypothetical protein
VQGTAPSAKAIPIIMIVDVARDIYFNETASGYWPNGKWRT